jgi:NAD(P)-dependent dehydrogenase (short-subunit alcohol dehydrogenase family)
MPMGTRLQGKVAVVVGAGAIGAGWGNGKASAVLYAREGAKVFAIDVNRAAAEETAAIIAGEGGICTCGIGDAASEQDMVRLVAEAMAAFGRIDVLHNNVATVKVGNPVDLSLADWDRSWQVNVTTMLLACKAVLPIMERQGAGAIVNISSVAAQRYLGVPYTAYYATKAAIVQFTRAVAIQYAAKGIRANTILPGFIDTPHVHAFLRDHVGGDTGSLVETRARQTPMRRMGTGWDVAYAALFLASDEAQYVTGTELVVDGGVSATAV